MLDTFIYKGDVFHVLEYELEGIPVKKVTYGKMSILMELEDFNDIYLLGSNCEVMYRRKINRKFVRLASKLESKEASLVPTNL